MTEPVTLSAAAPLTWKVLAKFPKLFQWLLQWRYPIGRCHKSLLVDLGASQARFELFSNRPSHAMTGLILQTHNHLPFAVSIEFHRITAVVQSQQFLDKVLNSQLLIPPSESGSTHLPEITLSEQQSKWILGLGGEWTNVRVELHFRCKSSIQSWEDRRSLEFLSSINTDRSTN